MVLSDPPSPCPHPAKFDAWGPGQDHNTTFGRRYAPRGYPMVCYFVNATLADNRTFSRTRCGRLTVCVTCCLPRRLAGMKGTCVRLGMPREARAALHALALYVGQCATRGTLPWCREGFFSFVDEHLKPASEPDERASDAAPDQAASGGHSGASVSPEERQEL